MVLRWLDNANAEEARTRQQDGECRDLAAGSGRCVKGDGRQSVNAGECQLEFELGN
jgi:hypothetical protein